MKKLLFIINPKAGTDKIKSIKQTVSNVLEDTFELDFQLTTYAGHATVLAENAVANEYYGVVAVGGDGSVNEIAQALIHTPVVLGILPMGSGNGLARSLHINLEKEDALLTIKNQHVEAIDVGWVNEEHYFLSNLGVGFDVKISKEFKNTNFRGFWGYSKLVTQHILDYKTKQYEIEIDGRIERTEAFLLNVANAEQFGFNFKIAPDANLQDGYLDIVSVEKFPILQGGKLLFDAFMGAIYDNQYVSKWRGKEISIKSKSLKYYQIDGDLITNKYTDKVDIKMVPKALNVFKP